MDGVICSNTFGNYENALPISESIKQINKLYNSNNYIFIFTSRFLGKANGSVSLAKKLGFDFTKKQLNEWGVLYHKLIFGKPEYDVIIDDKSIFFKKDWYKFLI